MDDLEFNLEDIDINPQWDDYLGQMIGDFGDTGYDEYLGINLPTFGDTDLSEALLGSESDVRFTSSGNMVFTNPDGTVVTYSPEGLISTQDPSGRNVFYHSGDGRDYVVDYSGTKPGDFVETFSRTEGGEGPTRYGAYHTTDGRDYFVGNEDLYRFGSNYDIFSRASGGEGPTRYTQYSGTGDNARVVDYSDVYGPGGGKITTTIGDPDDDNTRTVIYEDGKVTDTSTTNNIFKEILKTITNKDNAALMALLGGLMGLMGRQGGGSSAPPGYKGSIPKYTATRGQPTSPTAGGRRPGGAGIGSLTGGVTYAAEGGIMDLAKGGRPARYLAGGTDGMADKIQTDIDGKQPARLSHGEFVIPADVVSHLGNGNSDAGADVLYDMMAKVRKARTGNPKQGKQINPSKYTKV